MCEDWRQVQKLIFLSIVWFKSFCDFSLDRFSLTFNIQGYEYIKSFVTKTIWTLQWTVLIKKWLSIFIDVFKVQVLLVKMMCYMSLWVKWFVFDSSVTSCIMSKTLNAYRMWVFMSLSVSILSWSTLSVIAVKLVFVFVSTFIKYQKVWVILKY